MPPVIRSLDPHCRSEIDLVARRWEATLVEVLGEARAAEQLIRGRAWLTDHVRRHAVSEGVTGHIYLAEIGDGEIAGHIVVRLDDDGCGTTIGLIATIFVDPAHRRAGIGDALIARAEQWIAERPNSTCVTYTDEHNLRLHRLFARRGYHLTAMPHAFVELRKQLPTPFGERE